MQKQARMLALKRLGQGSAQMPMQPPQPQSPQRTPQQAAMSDNIPAGLTQSQQAATPVPSSPPNPGLAGAAQNPSPDLSGQQQSPNPAQGATPAQNSNFQGLLDDLKKRQMMQGLNQQPQVPPSNDQ